MVYLHAIRIPVWYHTTYERIVLALLPNIGRYIDLLLLLLMVYNDCHQTLYLNSADYKPIVKRGQVESIPRKPEAEKTDESQSGKKVDSPPPRKKKASATATYDPMKHRPMPIPVLSWPASPKTSTIPAAAVSSLSVCVGGFQSSPSTPGSGHRLPPPDDAKGLIERTLPGFNKTDC